MERESLPIACSLTDTELRERERTVLQKAAAGLLEVRELENGFSYRFPAEDAWLHQLTDIINLERKRCAFLSFKLVVESDSDSFWLNLTGPEGTKETLKSLFEWN
jgi:hypothetical protein